jgi:carboxyl-terminal processing protease
MAIVNFRQKHLRAWLAALALLCFLSSHLTPGAVAQQNLNFERDRGRIMLGQIKSDIKKNYYDPAFHGMDLEVRFKAAEEKINQATSVGQIFGIIAQAVIELNDSHTIFIPPQRAARTEYGWQMQVMGDACYVVAVKPGSDAEKKGLKLGDMIHQIDGVTPVKENLWKIEYLYYTLRPQLGMRVIAQSPGQQPRQLDVMAKVEQGRQHIDLTSDMDFMEMIREAESEGRLRAHRYYELGKDDALIWKMPAFDLSQEGLDNMMGKIKKRNSLILDLRGNPGGDLDMLLRLIGHLCDHDVKVGEMKRRKETKPLIAKTQGKKAFTGKIVVLIDSDSGSASEVLSRVLQMEKRATIIGDHSSGAVMVSKGYSHQLGADTVVFYSASVTDADLIMADGKSLEHVGVAPDEVLRPTATDMAAKLDPVLSRAAAIVGLKIEPKEAGTMFPIEWRK